MADLKISQLPNATTPLDGTEVLPIVQGGTTDKVTVANLTAGRAVSASSVELTGGTVNGVAYLNNSKVLTTSSALQFDGNNVLVRGNELIAFNTYNNATLHAGYIRRNTATANMEIAAQTIGANYAINLITSNTIQATVTAAGNVGIGTTAPDAKCAVVGTSGNPQARFGTANNAVYFNAFDNNPMYMTTSAINSTAFGLGTASNIPLLLIANNVTHATVAPGGDVTLNTGNIIQGVAAKGVNFTANTPAAGMTSQLLNWYEEGTWTPTDASGAGLTFTVTYAKYVRVGKQVTVNMFITFPSTASAAQATVGGLPFSVASGNYPPATFASNSGTALGGFANATAKTVSIGTAADYSSAVANSTLSGRNLVMSLTYLVD